VIILIIDIWFFISGDLLMFINLINSIKYRLYLVQQFVTKCIVTFEGLGHHSFLARRIFL
jgi:hypothetical protein